MCMYYALLIENILKLSKTDNIVVVTPSIGLLFPGGEHFEDKVFEKTKNGE